MIPARSSEFRGQEGPSTAFGGAICTGEGRARQRTALGSSTTAISPTWTPELRYLSEEKESVDPLKDSLLKRQKGVLQYVKQAQLQADRMGYRACVFVTLTASSGAADWDAKGAISAYTDKLSKWLLRRGVSPLGVWVAEPQFKNECRIHYHLLVWVPRRSHKWHLPKPDLGMWAHGSSSVEWAKKPAAYMAKYMGKLGRGVTTEKRERAFRLALFKWRQFRAIYPAKTRTFAAFGLDAGARARIRYDRLPYPVRCNHSFGTVERAPRGGGFVIDGRRRLCSPYVVQALPGFGVVCGISARWYRDQVGALVPEGRAYTAWCPEVDKAS